MQFNSALALLRFSGIFLVCATFSAANEEQVKPAPKAPKSVVEQAQAHLKSAKVPLAESLLVKYLQTQPNAPDAAECCFLLGQVQAKQNRTDDALRTFSVVISRYPKTDFAPQALAEQMPLYIIRRNPSAAEKNRDALLANYPKSPVTASVWSKSAEELFNQEKFKEAVVIYQKIEASLTPESSENFLIAKTLSDKNGDPEKLLPIAEKALNEDRIPFAKSIYEYLTKYSKASRLLPEIQTKLAWCLYLDPDGKELARAESLWREVIKKSKPTDPWYADSKWHLVQLHAGPKNQWKEAVTICNEITREQAVGTSAHEQAMFVRAWLLTVQDQGSAAVAAFDDLAAAYPDKMKQPPIIQHRERALKSAAKQSIE